MFFLGNPTQHMWEKLVPGPFKKNKIEHIKSQKCYKFVSILCLSRGLPKHIKIKVLITCFYVYIKLFQKHAFTS